MTWKSVTSWPLTFCYSRIISNLGIHYTTLEEARLKYDLDALSRRMGVFHQQPQKAAFFRQTLPQHFFSSDGSREFPLPADRSVEDMTTCQPAPRLAQQLWRNRLIEDVAEREGLAIQPAFWQMDMHGLHQTHLDRPVRDCTHFVHVPRWWLPVLDSLYTTAAEVLCKRGLAAARHCLDLDRNPPPDFTVPP